MHVFVATAETLGDRPDDYSFTVDGECGGGSRTGEPGHPAVTTAPRAVTDVEAEPDQLSIYRVRIVVGAITQGLGCCDEHMHIDPPSGTDPKEWV
jgi:hypothetical protein